MDCPKKAGEGFRIAWIFLESNKIPFHTIEVLVAFNQKFLDQFIHRKCARTRDCQGVEGASKTVAVVAVNLM